MDESAETMTLRTGTHRNAEAFTLIELVLVMALLCIVVTVGAPLLSRFFQGQTVAGEGQRFLAMTRYGQSRAVSEGVPMILRIDPSDGTYDLKPQEGFSSASAVAPADNDTGKPMGTGKDLSFQLPERLKFIVDPAVTLLNQQMMIRFAPDGGIDENSICRVVIRHNEGMELAIEVGENQFQYVIARNANATTTP